MKLSEEIFYDLFGNRTIISNFNIALAKTCNILKICSGKRKNVPKWVIHAVSKRDQRKCCFCDEPSDMDHDNSNLDHIVPLKDGGFNDVTNIQLLCESCNKKKCDRSDCVGTGYRNWYNVNNKG